jgi:aminoglycoside phosphotransferase
MAFRRNRRPKAAATVTPAPTPASAASAPEFEAPRPILHGFQGLRDLESHSGARVILGLREGKSVVRKIAGSAEQNERLMGQAARQRLLSAYGIPLPRVLGEGTDEAGLAFFEMDYFPGRGLAAAIPTAASYDREAALAAIDRMLWVFRANAGPSIPSESFLRKIASIAEICAAHAPASAHGETIAASAKRLAACNWDGIPVSPCHGDLTLDNILIGQANKIVFIDCDEPWVSSYWLDVGKLFQDIDGHWCLRDFHLAGESGAPLLNAGQKLAELAEPLRALAEECDPGLPARLPALAALHLFRTLPYVKSQALTKFVLARLAQVLASSA